MLQQNKHHTLLVQKRNKKYHNIWFYTVLSQIDFIQYKFDH